MKNVLSKLSLGILLFLMYGCSGNSSSQVLQSDSTQVESEVVIEEEQPKEIFEPVVFKSEDEFNSQSDSLYYYGEGVRKAKHFSTTKFKLVNDKDVNNWVRVSLENGKMTFCYGKPADGKFTTAFSAKYKVKTERDSQTGEKYLTVVGHREKMDKKPYIVEDAKIVYKDGVSLIYHLEKDLDVVDIRLPLKSCVKDYVPEVWKE